MTNRVNLSPGQEGDPEKGKGRRSSQRQIQQSAQGHGGQQAKGTDAQTRGQGEAQRKGSQGSRGGRRSGQHGRVGRSISWIE